MKFYILNLLGGGADTSCSDCLHLSAKERGPLGDCSLISVAEIDKRGAFCVNCGLEGNDL